jgi:hypothetical protein
MTKLFYILLFFTTLGGSLSAQKGFNYQAALRNADGIPVADSTFQLSVSILKGSTIGQIVYSEEHTVSTDRAGLFHVVIGDGESSDLFEDIPWGDDNYFIALKINGYTFSISQLMAVPYAMHSYSAETVKNVPTPVDKSYADSLFNLAYNTALKPPTPVNTGDATNKAYVDSLVKNVNAVDVSGSGDTLTLGPEKIIVPGLSSQNKKPYNKQFCFGGTDDETVIATLSADSGNLIIGAETFSRNGDPGINRGMSDVWIFEVAPDFAIKNSLVIGGSGYDKLTHLIRLPNGNLLAGGTTESKGGSFTKNNGEFDIWLAEIDSKNFSILWMDIYGGSKTEFLNDIHVFADGSMLIGGSTFSEDGLVQQNRGITDLLVIKIDNQKRIVWSKTYGADRFESLHSIHASPTGEFLLVGETDSRTGIFSQNNGGSDIFVISLDADGNILKTICTGTTENESAVDVVLQSGTLHICGISFALDWSISNSVSAQNIFYSTISPQLTVVSSTTIGGSNSEWPVGFSNDASAILCSSSSADGDIIQNKGDFDVVVIQPDQAGLVQNIKNFGGSYADEGRIMIKIADGFIIGGVSESLNGDLTENNGQKDIWVVKTDASLNITKQMNIGGSYDEDLHTVLYNGTELTIVGTTESSDFGIRGFHGKAGSNKDIWIVKLPF